MEHQSKCISQDMKTKDMLGRGSQSDRETAAFRNPLIQEALVPMPLIPALGKQRQTDLCEFGASNIYIASHRLSRAAVKSFLLPPTQSQLTISK